MHDIHAMILKQTKEYTDEFFEENKSCNDLELTWETLHQAYHLLESSRYSIKNLEDQIKRLKQ